MEFALLVDFVDPSRGRIKPRNSARFYGTSGVAHNFPLTWSNQIWLKFIWNSTIVELELVWPMRLFAATRRSHHQLFDLICPIPVRISSWISWSIPIPRRLLPRKIFFDNSCSKLNQPKPKLTDTSKLVLIMTIKSIPIPAAINLILGLERWDLIDNSRTQWQAGDNWGQFQWMSLHLHIRHAHGWSSHLWSSQRVQHRGAAGYQLHVVPVTSGGQTSVVR